MFLKQVYFISRSELLPKGNVRPNCFAEAVSLAKYKNLGRSNDRKCRK